MYLCSFMFLSTSVKLTEKIDIFAASLICLKEKAYSIYGQKSFLGALIIQEFKGLHNNHSSPHIEICFYLSITIFSIILDLRNLISMTVPAEHAAMYNSKFGIYMVKRWNIINLLRFHDMSAHIYARDREAGVINRGRILKTRNPNNSHKRDAIRFPVENQTPCICGWHFIYPMNLSGAV